MRAKYDFEIMELDDELVAVPVGGGKEQFHGVLKVNETAADILRLLKNEITEEEIVNSLLMEYTAERSLVAKYVHEYTIELKESGFIE